jgi:succinate-semialdehyde dehydrogenase/glutarate-semialdehyde dehydrogenase
LRPGDAAAVGGARAFAAWSTTTAASRADILQEARRPDRAKEALARLLTSEQGKSLTEARGEVGLAAGYVLWFSEEARRAYGDTILAVARRRIMVVKQPVGVVAAITRGISRR